MPNQFELLKDLMLSVGQELLTWRQTLIPETLYKEGKEVVSIFDFKAEQLIRQGLISLYPGIPIWGEELGRQGNTQEFILIDPIDGSKNYLAGLPEFASQIAYVKGEQVLWSIINLPALNQLYWAKRNEGAWCQDKKIQPSQQARIDLAIQCLGIGHQANDLIVLAQQLGSNLAEPRQFGSAGVHYAYVASGKVDLYLAKEAALYDFAPGYLLCQEAGLANCDLAGQPLHFSTFDQGIVLGNLKLIDQYIVLAKTSRPKNP